MTRKMLNFLFLFLTFHNSPLHYSEIIQRHKGLYSVSNKTNGIKIGLQLYQWRRVEGKGDNCRRAQG